MPDFSINGSLRLHLVSLGVIAGALLPVFGATRGSLNVLFIVVDDLKTDIGAFGHPIARTPNIDPLVARGMRFDRAYSRFTLCSPSRESFLSAIVAPNARVGASSRIVELLDLYRTLVEICGLPRMVGLEGRSLAPLLANPEASVGCRRLFECDHDGVLGLSVRTDPWRYTERRDGKDVVAQELYAHPTNSGELHNLAG